MVKRLPFYMVYDMEEFARNSEVQGMMQSGGIPHMPWQDEEWMARRDYDYMKSIYPDMAKRIMPYVEEECDRMEYSGSMMFDEYPDQLQVRMICRRIMKKMMDDDMSRNQGNSQNNWLYDFICVITWQEILRRRSDYRKYRR